MLKLATILDNPGEPSAETRYRDPAELRRLGYNGLVIYETVGLSGIDGPDAGGDAEMRQWIAQQFEALAGRIAAAREAGLDVYLVYDVLSLGRELVRLDPEPYTCKGRANVLCPASDAALERCAAALEKLIARASGGGAQQLAGVVLRFGDNDAARLPYLVGNDIYSPHCARCSQLGRADRITRVIDRFHQLVVTKLGLRLIARAWNVRPSGMHDAVELCRRLALRLPRNDGGHADPRFLLSFKFTQTDFWRYQRWNPSSLVFGDLPIIYELECQREYEGKGGIPNWQAPLWRSGPPEVPPPEVSPAEVNDARVDPAGLAAVCDRINLAGLWAWVRGGGWGGPFIRNETWIDANVFAVPRLADQPDIEPAQLARAWIDERLGVKDPEVADVLHDVLAHSTQYVLKAFYIGPYARSRQAAAGAWHPNADWVQDDLIDVQAAWRIIGQLPETALDEVVREKQEAAQQIALDRSALQQRINDDNRKQLEPLVHTLLYAESLFETLRDLVAGLVAYRRCRRSKDPATAQIAQQRLLLAQSHWQHHTQRHASLPGVATAFRETHFWDITQRMLTELSQTEQVETA